MAYIEGFRHQQWLLPPSLEDMIPEDHVCFLIEDFVDCLDFSRFDERYAGAGPPAYHPRVCLKLLVMGVLDQIRSSRRLARQARENVVYLYLAEKLQPDFRTLSDFRKNNADLITEVFKHSLTLARKEGLVDLSALSTDGSKVKANAANKRMLTRQELEVLSHFVDSELEAWSAADQVEDEAYGTLRGSDQIPQKSRQKIRRTVEHYLKEYREHGDPYKKELMQKLEKAQTEAEKHDLEKVSTTDPEARYLKNKKGRIEFGYNIQATVDRHGFFVAADVCTDGNDVKQLQPQVTQTRNNLGEMPDNVKWFFDTGYFEGENLHFLSEQKINAYILAPNPLKDPHPYDKEHFTYNSEKDEYICPQKQKLIYQHTRYDKTRGKNVRTYQGEACPTCTHQKHCTTSKKGKRTIKQYPHQKERDQMKQKMQSSESKKHYKIRSQTIEPAFGDLKQNKKFTTFHTRGLKNTRNELRLICTATNLQKIWQHKNKPNHKNKPLKNTLPQPTNKSSQSGQSPRVFKYEIEVRNPTAAERRGILDENQHYPINQLSDNL